MNQNIFTYFSFNDLRHISKLRLRLVPSYIYIIHLFSSLVNFNVHKKLERWIWSSFKLMVFSRSRSFSLVFRSQTSRWTHHEITYWSWNVFWSKRQVQQSRLFAKIPVVVPVCCRFVVNNYLTMFTLVFVMVIKNFNFPTPRIFCHSCTCVHSGRVIAWLYTTIWRDLNHKSSNCSFVIRTKRARHSSWESKTGLGQWSKNSKQKIWSNGYAGPTGGKSARLKPNLKSQHHIEKPVHVTKFQVITSKCRSCGHLNFAYRKVYYAVGRP